MSIVVPAVLPSSREDLKEKLALFALMPTVSRVQIDVVDGKFSSPMSWPYTDTGALEKMVGNGDMLPYLDRITYEIDLMCLDAEEAAKAWLALGATRLTFHAESITDLVKFFESVRARYGRGLVSIGIALNIESDLALIEPILGEIEYVQFMGIAQIGRQGQPFDERVLEKVRVFHSRHPELSVQVDGGVSLERAKELVALGVSSLIVGSGILRSDNPAAALAEFEALQTPYGV